MSVRRWGGGRRAMCVAAALVLAGACAPGAASSAERQFPTIVALGAAQPIETSEGRYTPIVVIDHESPGWYGDGRLNASVHTSTWKAGMTHPVAEALALGYAARARVTTEGESGDIYRDGDRDSASEFIGDSLAAIGTATLFPREPVRVSLELERMQAWFSRHENTRRGYELPSDFGQNEARLKLSHHGLLGEEDAKATLTGVYGERDGWEDWGLDDNADATREYDKTELELTQPLGWEGGSESKAEAAWLQGTHLDLFSAYQVGGLTGHYAVGGYYRNEFRAQRAGLLRLQHEHRFSPHRRLTVFAHGARLETVDTIGGADAEWVSLGSVGVGYYHGIRALHGLPVIVRYAEGLLIPEGSKEGHRREILLLVAAGF